MPAFPTPLVAAVTIAAALSLLPLEALGADLVITNVTLIDTRARSAGVARLAGRAIWISNGTIERVGAADSLAIPAGARVVDGSGQYVIPGLWDMHVHLNRDEATLSRCMFPLMVAHGVTGVRDMESDCWEPCKEGRRDLEDMRALQRRLEAGEILGPRLLSLSSAIVWGAQGVSGYPENAPDYYQPRTGEQARELARRLKDRGVDFAKIYNNFPREPFFAFMEEAGRIGLDVSGHLPWSVTPEEAARAGVRTIEHARWPGLACGPAYEEFRAEFAEFATGNRPDFPEGAFGRLKDTAVRGFDEGRCRRLLRTLAESGTHLVPTHVTRKMDAMASDPVYRADPRRKYIPMLRLRGWDRDLEATANGPPELLEFYRDFYALGLRVTGMAHEEGVPILLGTDTLDTHAFPGFSVHDELEHLVQAGLTPLEALQAATLRPAAFLGREDRHGQVASGAAADLVLLGADPLDDIRNTTRIEAVILRGRYMDRTELDTLIQGVEDYTNPVLTDLPLDQAARRLYIGAYESENQPVLHVFEEDAGLSVRWEGGSGYRILHQGNHVFLLEVSPDLSITFDVGEQAESAVVRRGEEEATYTRRP